MNTTKFFFQGFLFVFGLSSAPFMKDVQAKEKIGLYWEKVVPTICKVFDFETSKKTK